MIDSVIEHSFILVIDRTHHHEEGRGGKRKKNYQQFNKLVLDKRKYIDKLGDFFSYTDTFKKSMSSVKKYLKSAKAALESNDPLLALEHAGDALEEDPNCYFAHVFQGKSYQLLRDIPKAIAAFQKLLKLNQIIC